ncbi:hypothetical protein [Synechococcus sp. HK01-R]|uniref:hypothetical protein n=1 Tax=Synechococcus sp. HK01-R TaxID=2751171 RepID=UPI00162709CA|nr:hypothetical protein [Synechococcus sp. HK01-R]QNG26079.1 hypothetical protein H0O21_07105 [Synechococcus sp. HK01-R]
MQRATDPARWGPLSRYQLIKALADAHNRHEDYCARWGCRGTDAYLVAHQQLRSRYQQGLTIRLSALPWHAQQVAQRIQLQGVWA